MADSQKKLRFKLINRCVDEIYVGFCMDHFEFFDLPGCGVYDFVFGGFDASIFQIAVRSIQQMAMIAILCPRRVFIR